TNMLTEYAEHVGDEPAEGEGGEGEGEGEGADDGGEESGVAVEGEGDEGAGDDTGGDQPRGDHGHFAEKPKVDVRTSQDPKKAAAAGGKPADKPAEGEEEAAGEDAPKWEQLAVHADGAVAVDNNGRNAFDGIQTQTVKGADGKGFTFFAVPTDRERDFRLRLSQSVSARRVYGQMVEAKRKYDAMASAPPRETDSQVDARIFLEHITPLLPQMVEAGIIDQRDVDLWKAKADGEKLRVQNKYRADEEKRVSEASQPTWPERQVEGIALEVAAIIDRVPELQSLSQEDREAVFQECLQVANAVYFQDAADGNKPKVNQKFIFDRLSARYETAKSRANGNGSGPTQRTAGGKTPTPSATGNGGKKPADAAERFNNGVKDGQKATAPRTTNLKAGRGNAAGNQSPTRRNAPTRVPAGKTEDDVKRDAEDHLRRTQRRFLSSGSLDLPPADDE
ncbi:MAG TPA: hypothetical protein VNN79_22790, partial [Actinomycetota bacterium]|nr:hypothetical protein [Actinomycetota bacterium]